MPQIRSLRPAASCPSDTELIETLSLILSDCAMATMSYYCSSHFQCERLTMPSSRGLAEIAKAERKKRSRRHEVADSSALAMLESTHLEIFLTGARDLVDAAFVEEDVGFHKKYPGTEPRFTKSAALSYVAKLKQQVAIGAVSSFCWDKEHSGVLLRVAANPATVYRCSFGSSVHYGD